MGGVAIAALQVAASEMHVSAACIDARNNRQPSWNGTNSVLRLEPTWGDPDLLVRIVQRVAPNNQAQLLAAFSAGHSSAKAIQSVRNSSAHSNTQTLSEVVGLASRYTAFPITHATHAMFWADTATGNFLITHAMDDLRTNALAAVS
jgi:hypothetical protein